MGTIRMIVKAIDWTEGDVGKIHVKLKRGSCRIDWGDGKSTSLFTYTEDWVSANHQYPSRCNMLVYLDCRNNYSLKKLAISNRSVIKVVLLYETELDERSMKYLVEAIERNEGEIKMTERLD